MTINYSDAVRDARNDSIETTIGTAAKLEIRTGAKPANTAAADSGTLLGTLTLPSDWMANSSGGVKAKSGTWSGTATGAGTAGHYRLKDNALTACHEQGSLTATGGGGDAEIDNVSVAIGQVITVATYSKTGSNP